MGKRRSPASHELSRLVQTAFGDRLRRAREAADPKVSQAAIAGALEVSRTSISNIENGRHRVFLDHVYAAARALRISASSLMPDDGALTTVSAIHSSPDGGLDSNQLRALEPMVVAARKSAKALAKRATRENS